jgi:hypothetical protein
MYPFDNIRRNWNVRSKLHSKAERLLSQYEIEMENATEIENDDEFDARMDEIDNTIMNHFWDIYKTEFALCYPESRNEWFINFVNSFPEGRTSLSEKQYNVFKKHCEDNDETWKTYTCYCRVGNKLISLTWRNANRSVNIEVFKNAKELLS